MAHDAHERRAKTSEKEKKRNGKNKKKKERKSSYVANCVWYNKWKICLMAGFKSSCQLYPSSSAILPFLSPIAFISHHFFILSRLCTSIWYDVCTKTHTHTRTEHTHTGLKPGETNDIHTIVIIFSLLFPIFSFHFLLSYAYIFVRISCIMFNTLPSSAVVRMCVWLCVYVCLYTRISYVYSLR